MKGTGEFPQRLAAATRHWLEFQILCNREMLLSESYLAQPVGEFLRNEYNLPIQTERNHPNLNRPGPGRPRQIDYVLLARDEQRITTAIEAKWISEQPLSLQRLVDMVFRLECLRNIGKKGNIDRYFLVAGRIESIRAKLFNRKKSKEAKSSIKAILPFKAGTIRVKVRECEKAQRKLYKQFADSYEVPLPITFDVTLLEDSVGDNVRVLIWQVAGVPGRGAFDPSYWGDVKQPEVDEDL